MFARRANFAAFSYLHFMQSILLHAHSGLRWLVLIFGLLAALKALFGWLGKNNFTNRDAMLGLLFVLFTHLQVVIGLVYYFVYSTWFSVLTASPGEVMKNSVSRFWAVEHPVAMLLAAVLITVGRVKSKKGGASKKHSMAAVFFTLGLLLIFLSIPWPFRTDVARPLF